MPTKTQQQQAMFATGSDRRVSFIATATFDLEATKGGSRRPTFAIKAYTGASMNVAYFSVPVIIDLAGLKAGRGNIPIFLNHDPAQIVGQTESVHIDAAGVDLAGFMTGLGNPPTETVLSHARDGFEWQASVGASIVRQEFLKSGEKAVVNGREITGPHLIAREARLFETSFVPIGADSQTVATVAASSPNGLFKEGDNMFEAWLQAKGIDPTAVDENTRKALRASFDAEQAAQGTPPVQGNAPPPTLTLDQVVETRRKEDERVAKITAAASRFINDRPSHLEEFHKLARAAIASASTVEEFELAAYKTRASVSHSPSMHVDVRMGQKMVEASVCLAGGLEDIGKHFDAATLNAASDQFPNGIGLRDLLMIAAKENGYAGHTSNDIRPLLEAAFGRVSREIRANDGFSTLSLPGILSNVANKFLVQGWMSVEAGWREIASRRNVRDFKTNTSYSLTGAMTYEKVGPGGELKHATVGELAYTNRAETYGRMFAITRNDIINDDLGALTEIPMRLGRGAALKLNEVFWTEFLADVATFYSTAHGNVSSGATSVLSSAGLTAAQLKFRKQTDPDGKPLGIVPRILVVPPELEITADELMTSLIVNTGGASTTDKVPNRNVWTNKYRVVSSSYLSNSTITNYSAAHWFLLADPVDMPVIEVAFLNGRETPIVESAEADFNVLGVQMRGYHDFGVAKQEYRGGVRSIGS